MTRGFNIIVFAEAVIAYNKRNIRRVIFYGVVAVGFNAKRFKAAFKRDCKGLPREAGDNNTADKKTYTAKSVDKAQSVKVIGYAKVASAFFFLNSVGVYNNNNFRFVFKL